MANEQIIKKLDAEASKMDLSIRSLRGIRAAFPDRWAKNFGHSVDFVNYETMLVESIRLRDMLSDAATCLRVARTDEAIWKAIVAKLKIGKDVVRVMPQVIQEMTEANGVKPF